MASLAAVHQASGRERDLAALTFIETFERSNQRFGVCGRVRYRILRRNFDFQRAWLLKPLGLTANVVLSELLV